MTLPLSGFRVLDLTSVVAGPYASYHLGLMGADVLKVENPRAPDAARGQGADPELNAQGMGASFLGLNAGKRAITLNLKHAEGKAILLRLAERSDVLLENFRPGVMERLGLSAETLVARWPRLIYCAISGFGQDSPVRDKPAYDQIVQGMSGAMSTTGSAESGPLRAGYPVADTVAGLNAAFAVAAALVQRERTGAGQIIDVSMLDSQLSVMGWALSNALIAGQRPVLGGNDNFTASPSGSFRVADGLINIAANMQAQFEALCRVVARPELIADPRFPDADARIRNRAALKGELEAALTTRPAAHWLEALAEAEVPAGPVLWLDEALELPTVRERGSIRRIDAVSCVSGPVEVFLAGYRSSTGAPTRDGSPPAPLGADTDAVLAELGYTPAQIAALREDGAI